jgi:hypothetical protein
LSRARRKHFIRIIEQNEKHPVKRLGWPPAPNGGSEDARGHTRVVGNASRGMLKQKRPRPGSWRCWDEIGAGVVHY